MRHCGSGEGEGEGEDEDAPGGKGKASWAAEEYEADAARNVDTAFIKFSKKVKKAPDQCVRYRWARAAV